MNNDCDYEQERATRSFTRALSENAGTLKSPKSAPPNQGANAKMRPTRRMVRPKLSGKPVRLIRLSIRLPRP